MRAGFRIDQLDIDPRLVPGPPHAAFEHVAHAELAADLPGIDRLPGIAEGGIAGDHEAGGDARQIGGQIVGDAVGEILLLRIVAEIGEGQHDDRQPRRDGRLRD